MSCILHVFIYYLELFIKKGIFFCYYQVVGKSGQQSEKKLKLSQIP